MYTSILAWLQIFSSYFFAAFLFVFPNAISYKTFSIIIAFLSIIAFLIYLKKTKCIITRRLMYIIICFLVVSICYYYVTPLFYGGMTYKNGLWFGEFLALIGQTFPGVVIATIVGSDEDQCKRTESYTLVVSIVFAFLSLYCTLHPSGSSSAGLAINENNLDYQSLSYMAAYSAGLALSLLLTLDQKRLRERNIAIIIVVTALLTILLSGGRGGLVTYILFLITFAFLYIKTRNLSLQTILKIVLVIIAFIVIIQMIITFAANSNLATSGFSRIVRFLSGNEASGRDGLRRAAINSFLTSPIWGHGIGSVFYEIGGYSHNIFTDIMVEFGIIGIVIFCSMLIRFFIRVKKLINEDVRNCTWLFVFLCGFVMSLFSGYYIAIFPLWWAMFCVLAKDK